MSSKINPEEFEGWEGKGSSKKKERNPNSQTSKAARQETRRKGKEKRAGEAKKNISNVLQNFPKFESPEKKKSYIERYLAWIRASIQSGEPVLDENTDLEFEYTRSGAKAGGQNVNKVSSAVRCTHKISNITVRNEETRDQFRNKQNAISKISEILVNHINNWKTLEKDPEKINRMLIVDLL